MILIYIVDEFLVLVTHLHTAAVLFKHLTDVEAVPNQWVGLHHQPKDPFVDAAETLNRYFH